MKALVIGAGIGGTCAAVALQRAGVDVVVHEQSSDLRTFGGGFELWVNGVRAVRSIGLGDQAEAIGHPVKVGQAVTWRGRKVAEWPVGEVSARLGAPVLGVSRPDLHRMFVDGVAPDVFVTGSAYTGFTQHDGGVEVTFADGRTETADVLIAADGLRSALRAELLGHEEPRYAGYTVWRAILDFEHEQAPHGVFRLHWGRGARFLFFRVGPARMYWSAMLKTAPDGTDDGGHRPAVLHHFGDFVEPVAEMVEATDERAIIRQDVFDRPPSKRWGEGRVTLLGDAAHPMSPDQGQGANQAIEDGVVLAQCLSENSDAVAALRQYEKRRMKRTAGFQKNSRMIARMGLQDSPVVCAVRDRVTRAMDPVVWRLLQKRMDVEF